MHNVLSRHVRQDLIRKEGCTFSSSGLWIVHEPMERVHMLCRNDMNTLASQLLIVLQALRYAAWPCYVLCYGDQSLCHVPASWHCRSWHVLAVCQGLYTAQPTDPSLVGGPLTAVWAPIAGA